MSRKPWQYRTAPWLLLRNFCFTGITPNKTLVNHSLTADSVYPSSDCLDVQLNHNALGLCMEKQWCLQEALYKKRAPPHYETERYYPKLQHLCTLVRRSICFYISCFLLLLAFFFLSGKCISIGKCNSFISDKSLYPRMCTDWELGAEIALTPQSQALCSMRKNRTYEPSQVWYSDLCKDKQAVWGISLTDFFEF